MSNKKRTLDGQLSHRIFGLFILSAVVPILAIALISYSQITSQLEKESKRQVYRESRSSGLALYDRLLSLEANLSLISNTLSFSYESFSLPDDKWLRSIYQSIFIIDDLGGVNPLVGEVTSLPRFSYEQEQHLQNGSTLLKMPLRNDDPEGIFLIRTQELADQKNGYLVGRLNVSYLWELGISSPDIFCILNDSEVLLYCSETNLKENDEKVFVGFKEATDGNFNYWRINDSDYAVNIWSIFLESHFHEENINLVLAKPRKTVLASLEQYKNIFPQALLITALLVVLLSISLIRRSLIPLEKLTKGTNKIARGEYDVSVEISSGDEFEKLGESFNKMARRIGEQFRTIGVLATIDRLILSTFDKNEIIETLIGHLQNMVNAEHVCVVTLEDKDKGMAIVNINQSFDSNKNMKVDVLLDKAEYTQLDSCNDYFSLNVGQPKSYLKHLIDLGDQYFLVLPVRTKEGIIAFICISTKEEVAYADETLLQLREMTDRVAVALSNADWEAELYHQAHYDMLTQLPNRAFFQIKLEEEIEAALRNNSYIALLFIDIDRFKGINDSLGYAFGDQVLVHLAGVLAECIGDAGMVSRFGGDEFIVLITEINDVVKLSTKVRETANRLQLGIGQSFTLNRREVYVTPSIGIALFPRDADNYNDLLKNADTAMYSAKKGGRDCYKFYSSEQNENTLQLLDMANDLRYAMQRDELSLLYQPKVSFETGKVVGAEALIRWEHPIRGAIPADEFIFVAEESGIISEIGLWVLETACRQNKKWIDEAELDIKMAVNLSAEQFRQPDLYESIKQVVRESKLPANYMELEITESLTIENFKKTIDILGKLQGMGLSIAIDDFGTGYSSLSYLQQFPIDKLKIDRSFMNNVPHDSDSTSIVKAIVALGHGLNLNVTAEGIEDAEQFEFMREIKCDEAQGFYISHPLTGEEFKEFVETY